MFCLTIGAIPVVIELPDQLENGLTQHLAPFTSRTAPSDACIFRSEFVGILPPPVSGAWRRGVFFREYTPFVFALSTDHFCLHADLDSHRFCLQIVQSTADYASIIFSAIKWCVVFEVVVRGGIPLHSSLIVGGTSGVLFSGASGSGKSTIARLLTSAGQCWQCGGDELNGLFPHSGAVSVAPTPFVSVGGRGVVTANIDLRHLYFLRHASKNSLEALDYRKLFHQILKNSFMQPTTRFITETLCSNIEKVAAIVDGALLYFKNDESVVSFFNNNWKLPHEAAL